MSIPDHRERLRSPLAAALARHAETSSECERRRGEPPRPGDVFAFADTAELAVLWTVLERHRDGRGLLLVATDQELLVGSADVAAPAEGVLCLRCHFAVWLEEADFAAARRVGTMEPGVLERARRKREAIAAQRLAGSVLEQETDLAPEYREWSEVLAKARAALARRRPQPDADTGVLVPFRPRAAGRGSRRLLALAAAMLLGVGLGLGGGWLWRRSGEGPAAVGPAELVNLPFAVLRPRDVRGTADTLTVPPEAVLVHLILTKSGPAYPGYRLEIEAGDGELIWTGRGLETGDTGMLSVALPAALLVPGEYRLRLFGLDGGETVSLAEYALEIRGL